MSIFTFISRKIASAIRPKIRIFPPAQKSNLSWKKFKPPKIKRGKWFISLQKWRHLEYPPPAKSNLSWKPLWFLRRFKIKRAKVSINLQQKQWRHQYITPPRPSNLSWKAAWFLRRPKIKRAKIFIALQKKQWRHEYITPPTPSNLSWLRPKFLRPKIRRRRSTYARHPYIFTVAAPPPPALVSKRPPKVRIKRGRWLTSLQKWRHLAFPPAQPSKLSWKKFKPPKIRRRRSTYIRHPYIVPAPGALVWKRPAYLRPRIKRAKSIIPLQRWRHAYVTPPQPVGFIAKQRPLLRVHRRKFFPRRLGKYSFPGAPPPPQVMTLQKVWRVYLTRPRRG